MQQNARLPNRLTPASPLGVILALLITLGINFLAEALPIAGRTTGEISDQFPVLVTPADYVFSIWTLIYSGLIVYAVYQAVPAGRKSPVARRIAPWFIASSVFNSLWIIAWHYLGIGLSVLLMLGLLISLIVIYQLAAGAATPAEYWMVKLPFSIYLAWICVASIVNIAVWLSQLGWGGWGIPNAIWAALVLSLAALVGLTLLRLHRNGAFALVLVWALIGIAVGQWPTVGMVFFALVLTLILIAALWQRFMQPQWQPFSRIKSQL